MWIFGAVILGIEKKVLIFMLKDMRIIQVENRSCSSSSSNDESCDGSRQDGKIKSDRAMSPVTVPTGR